MKPTSRLKYPLRTVRSAAWIGAGLALSLGFSLRAVADPISNPTANLATTSIASSAITPITPIAGSTAVDPTPAPEQLAAVPPASPAAAPNVTTIAEQSATPAAADEIAVLTPASGTVLSQPSTSLTIQYPIGANVDVFVNGQAADRGLIGRTETNQATHRVTETWYGIILNSGKNNISLKRAGEVKSAASIDVQVSGQPAKIKVSTLEAHVPADGRSTVTVQGQLQDESGYPSNWSADVTLDASAGEFVGTDQNPDSPGFQVKAEQGRFTAQLRAPSQAQPVRIRAQSGAFEGYYQFQFETIVRKLPLATGVIDFRLGARGTNYYDNFRDFLPADQKNGPVLDVKGAAFATVSVGDWLFTGAVNTSQPLNRDADGRNSLLGISPTTDQLYPTYGDSSTTEKVTPSQDSLYLKFERTSPIPNAGSDYALWGDFTTSEFATASQEFTATSRTLHGFKANYNIGSFQLSALYSNTVQGFQRDTIAPDGTSGFYFVSQRNLLNGSENVVLELEELNRPGTVVAAQPLLRDSDYTVDYDRGSIFFRNPVLRTDTATDGTLLVRRIVVTYQYNTPGQNNRLWAARGRYFFSRTPQQESWVGSSYLREDHGAQDFELFGLDTRIALGKTGSVIAEYAHSMNKQDGTAAVNGSAYRIVAQAELLKGLTGQAYFRSADAGFSNNATVSFVPGQRRYGATLSGQVTPKTRLSVQVDHEDDFGIAPQIITDLYQLIYPGASPQPGAQQDNSLTTVTAGIDQAIGSSKVGLKYIYLDRTDRIANTQSQASQLEATLSIPLRKDLTFNSLAALNISGGDPIYTNRVQAGLAWQVDPNVSIQLNQYYFWGGQYGTRAVTSLDTLGHYNIFKDTQLTGRFSMVGSGNALTGVGAAGIKQHWEITHGLNLNAAYEYVVGQFFGTTAAGTQFAQPYAVGSGASALGLTGGHNFSIGLDYTDNPDLKASFNYQYRTSSSGNNSVVNADVLGKFNESLTGLIHFNQGGAANQLLGLLGDTADLRVGLAFRNPSNDKFNGLLRYEYRQNPSITPDTILLGSGTGSSDHTFSAEGIYAPNWRWEFYGKTGFRYSTSNLANDFSNSSALFLSQLRATYRLNYRWDLAAEGRMINGLSTGSSEFGASAEVGYYLTPNLRLAAGYSFGSVFDADLGRSRHAGGPYLDVTVKLDELFSGFRLLKKQRRPEPAAPSPEPPSVSSEQTNPADAATPNTTIAVPNDVITTPAETTAPNLNPGPAVTTPDTPSPDAQSNRKTL